MLNFNINIRNNQLIITLAGLPSDCRTITINLPDGRRLSHPLSNNSLSPPAPLPLAEYLSGFLNYLDVYENRRPNTLAGYRKRLAQFAAWCQKTGRNPAQPDTWLAYYAGLKRRGLSPYTLKGHYHILNRFARWLVDAGRLAAHPLAGVQPPDLPKNNLPKAILKNNINNMLAAAQTPRERALLLFFRDTGCRAAEALSLTWGDLDLDTGAAGVIGKGNKRRDIFLRPPTRRALKTYRQTLACSGPNDPVWQGRQGKLTYDGLYKLFKNLAVRAGLDEEIFSPHAWRHAFGRDTTIAGIPTAQLQELLGHSDISTTKIYARFDTTELQQAHARYSPVESDAVQSDAAENDNLTQNADGIQ